MRNGKYSKRGVASKSLVMILALVLVIGCTVGGTLAWLTDKTAEVKNTFTTSDVDIELAETTGDSYKMVPGATITKDPKVTVKAVSEACMLFVKVEKSTNFDHFMTYEMAEGWAELTGVEGVTGVYYREVENTDADQDFAVIKDNKVTVKDTVTKEMMNNLTEATYPTLTVTAYASQLMKNNDAKFTAAEAWANVNPQPAA